MDAPELKPIAQLLVDGYLASASFSRTFGDEYDQPPTLMTRVHHMLSVVQAGVGAADGYQLGAEYADYGRVEILDIAHKRVYLLRSASAVNIERNVRNQTEQLFDTSKYISSPVVMLVYKFRAEGLDISIAGTRRLAGKKRKGRLEVTGSPTLVHTWPYDFSTSTTFDQGSMLDAFDELGEIDLDDEAGEK